MTEHVHEIVIKRFVTLYGDPATDDARAFVGEYVSALRGYETDLLRRGIDRVVQSHAYRSWPTVGACVKACDELYRPPSAASSAVPSLSQASAESRRRVGEMTSRLKIELGDRHAAVAPSGDRRIVENNRIDAPEDDATRRASFDAYIRQRDADMFELHREAIRARMAAGVS